MITCDRSFPGCLESAAVARAWATSLLPDCPVLDNVVLCLTELVTNSILYSRSQLPGGELTVRIEIGDTVVLVDVADQGPALPGTVLVHGLGAGWQIIRELSDWCGRDGNRAWFVTSWGAAPADRPLHSVNGSAQ